MGALKNLIGGMNFSSFLIAEDVNQQGMNARSYILSLDTYQEMKQSDETRSPTIKLAGDFLKAYGDEPLSKSQMDDIFDSFDDIAREVEERKLAGINQYGQRIADRDKKDRQADAAPTTTDAPTARRNRGATHQKGKFEKAAAEMQSFSDSNAQSQGERLNAAKERMGTDGPAPARGEKTKIARGIFDAEFDESKPSVIIRKMMEKAGMGKAHATTYYYKFKKLAANTQ